MKNAQGRCDLTVSIGTDIRQKKTATFITLEYEAPTTLNLKNRTINLEIPK